jgi:PAS domain S-box-containing protein
MAGVLVWLGWAAITAVDDLADERDKSAALAVDLADRARQVALIADAVPAAIAYVDAQERYVFVNAGYQRILGRDPAQVIGRTAREVIGDGYVEAEPAIRRALKGETVTTEVERRLPIGSRHLAISYNPHTLNGRTIGFFSLIIDVTERKRDEERLRLLVAELNHRVKNAMAVALAIVNQSFRSTRSIPEAREAILGRLHALGIAMDLLNRTDWSGVRLDELVSATLASFGDRVEPSGPPVWLGARAAQTLSLVLYELGSNAAKHGALAAPEGRAVLRWSAEGRFELDWFERGGPATVPPAKGGFGTALLGRVVAADLEAETSSAYEPAGFTYRLVAPLRAVVMPGPDQGERSPVRLG